MKTEIVTTLKREATRILAELRKDHEPVLITEHGKPSAYLIDADDYEMMQNRMILLEGIARGERAILEEKVISHSNAKLRMEKWLK
ncbi:MAG: prevent-host-death family protein [Desulfobacteraceae bacterium 4572_35.2]|nr:MAG: prevent-host-death family protein [Desulfobacteraceae bacterium 4572_35.2]